MPKTQEFLGKIVTIKGTDFDGCQGIVMDVQSRYEPEDGPIAVFFDKEVSPWKFGDEKGAIHWNGVPTIENYEICPRIICFELSELQIVGEFSPETIADRLFKGIHHTVKWWKFPLVPDTHLCQLGGCQSGDLATTKTYINSFGTVWQLYTCQTCHSKFNGWCVDGLKLKQPLPGLPDVGN